MTCDRFQAAVLASDDLVVDLTRPGALAAHAAGCDECRRWVAGYVEGAARWLNDGADDLASGVVAQTSGAVCEHTRLRLTAAPDDPPAPESVALVAGHVGRCEPCRAFASAWSAVSAELPALAELDPGPGFAAAVLARTSQRPGTAWRGRLLSFGSRLARRPRFAWEVAYVVTLCWLLIFGSPVAVLDWTTARVGAVAADAVPAGVRDAPSQVQARVRTWRDSWGIDVGRASAAIDAGEQAAGRYVQGGWRLAAHWWSRLLSGIADLLASSWQAIRGWIDDGPGADDGGRAEPAPPPVRSGQ